MSNQPQTQNQQTEIKKSPFDQTFLCPKCSEILFTKICYYKNTNIPMVHFMCPQKHSGVVDLILFFDLFYSSNQEIENELSKFDEDLEKDIEEYRNKKLQEIKKNEEQKISIKSKSKSKEKKDINKIDEDNNENKEKDNKEIDNNKEIENNIDINNIKLFKELEKCSIIKFTLLNDKKDDIINNNNNNNNKKSKEKKAINHKITNKSNTIKKINSSEKNEKDEKIKEEKFLCEIHNKSHFVAYCHSCKKNLCKKCLKLKKHKRKMFKHIKIKDNALNELNKILGQCQESLNKFENKNKLLLDSLPNNEEKKKIILYIMSNAFIEINKEYLNEVKLLIKNYNNNVKNKMLNYDVIMSIKNIKIKNNIIIPNDIQELISIIRNYKDYLFENISSENITNNNRYRLFETFNDIVKNYEIDNGKDINFSYIIENEKFRKLINLSDFKDEEINEKYEGDCDENRIHEVEKLYDLDDGDEEMEEFYDEDEEFENGDEIEDYDDDINNEEDENNYGDDEDGLKDDEDKD